MVRRLVVLGAALRLRAAIVADPRGQSTAYADSASGPATG